MQTRVRLSRRHAFWTLAACVVLVFLAVPQGQASEGETRTFVAYSMKVAQERVERAVRNRGGLHFSIGQHEQAISDSSAAISLDPRFADAFVNRGSSYFAEGMLDKAIEDFAQAIQLSPRHGLAYPLNEEAGRTRQRVFLRFPLSIRHASNGRMGVRT